MNRSAVEAQRDFHARLFRAFDRWPDVHESIADFTGDRSLAGMLGLDQLGHFGPQGCDRIVDEILRHSPTGPLRLCELGAGFGGASRYVVDRLRAAGRAVESALAIDIVPGHCRINCEITESLGFAPLSVVQADVAALPLGGGAVDVIFVTGSVPHFCDMPGVLIAARRCLQPGGLLVFTEEISLQAADVPLPASFRATFPDDVVFLATVDERRRQLAIAGFEDACFELVSDWGTELLRDRIRALRLFRGTAERVFGSQETDDVITTLEIAHEAYECGAILPAVVSARR